VLFVQHDEPQVAQGGEQRRARAHHDALVPGTHLAPLVVPLAGAKPTVHHRQSAREACSEASDRLGRQGDLRHEDNGGLPPIQRLPHGPQVDLRLAAARHALQQEDVAIRPLEVIADGLPDDLLFGSQSRRDGRHEGLAGQGIPPDLPLLQLHEAPLGERPVGGRGHPCFAGRLADGHPLTILPRRESLHCPPLRRRPPGRPVFRAQASAEADRSRQLGTHRRRAGHLAPVNQPLGLERPDGAPPVPLPGPPRQLPVGEWPLTAQEVQQGALRRRERLRSHGRFRRLHGFHHHVDVLGDASGQHGLQYSLDRRQVIVGYPEGQCEEIRRQNGLGIGQPQHIARLRHRRPVIQPDHDALQRTRAEGYPDEVAGHQAPAEPGRDTVMESPSEIVLVIAAGSIHGGGNAPLQGGAHHYDGERRPVLLAI